MALIKVSKDVLQKFRVIKEPGYREVTITDIKGPTRSSKGTSMNYLAVVKVVAPEEDAGIEFMHNFNDSEMGQKEILEALAAIEGFRDADALFESGNEIEIDPSQMINKPFSAELIIDSYQGKLQNKIKAFAPAGYSEQTVPFG